jgi:heme exporter protein A
MQSVTDSSPSLELEAVELTRGERRLVSGLSFSLAAGQLALVTGPNGTGKTTLLRTVAGLAPPSSGAIRFAGRPIMQLHPDERRLMVYQAHLDGMKKDLTVQENIIFYNEVRGCSDSISNTLAELGLNGYERRAVRRLSAGQKRRVALATLKHSGARLWLLDEPLTNLDTEGRQLVAGWIDRHLADGGMAMVATHLAEELKRPGCMLVEL